MREGGRVEWGRGGGGVEEKDIEERVFSEVVSVTGYCSIVYLHYRACLDIFK